jgi:hypothetical protein
MSKAVGVGDGGSGLGEVGPAGADTTVRMRGVVVGSPIYDELVRRLDGSRRPTSAEEPTSAPICVGRQSRTRERNPPRKSCHLES